MPEAALPAGVDLLDDWVAGTFYYDVQRVAEQLSAGDALLLRREPGNPYDSRAVEVLTMDGVKLGYVPRRVNAGIARRLDAGMTLGCSLVRWEREGALIQIRFRVLSLAPGDAPDPVQMRAPARAPRVAVATPPYQVNALRNALSNARVALGKGDRRGALGHLDSASNWALDLWALTHPGQIERRTTWVDLYRGFMQEWPDPLRPRVFVLTLVLATLARDETDPDPTDLGWPEWLRPILATLRLWHIRYAAPWARNPADALARLDWAYLSELTAVTAVLSGTDDQPRTPPRAHRLPVARREQVLRCLFRWFRLMDDHQRLGVVPVTRMMAMRALSWDRGLVIELQTEALKSALKVMPATLEEELRYLEDARRWPGIFEVPPVPFPQARGMIEEAIRLMQAEPRDRTALAGLAERLRALRPATLRRKRRRVRRVADDLTLTECFARNAASEVPDPYVAIRLLTVCVPYRRLDRLRLHDLERIADLLARRYFGMSHQLLRNALPPPAFARSDRLPLSLWLWRDQGPTLPRWITAQGLVSLWAQVLTWSLETNRQWSDPHDREAYRQALHLRTQVRGLLLLSPRRVARRVRDALDAADFRLLAGTRDSPHLWGEDWAHAYGHSPTTHWWYYRAPPGFAAQVDGLM